jgi:hypothetical protein
MSRRVSFDPGFGSDSFLDILANMVGILIILIVIAGVQVARAPVAAFLPEAPPEEAEEIPEPELEPVPIEVTEPEPEIVLEPEVETNAPPAEFSAALRALEAELARLRDLKIESEARIRSTLGTTQAAEDQIARAEESMRDQLQALEENRSEVARLQQSLGDRKETLTGLLAEFEEARNARAPVQQIRHRLSPVSQEVQGDEIHFRLMGNRVSVIPLTQLVERVKSQVERQKDWLARHSRNQGVVGPIDGYSLRYVAERQQLSAMEERKLGYGAFRIGVASWELVPDAGMPSETAEQALRRGSRFVVALQSAPEKASLTFWVYPDSFGLYRQLQEAAHAEGFLVAARPLPEGVPIAGSPHGTRSAGQ